jgi:PAS domain S-box-containing protein
VLQPDRFDKSGPQQSEQFVQAALDALSAHIAILNHEGEIIGVNEAWRRFAEDNQLKDPNYSLGENYLHICDRAAMRNSQEAEMVAAGIRSVLSQQTKDFNLEYPCHSPYEKRWFNVHITRFNWSGSIRLIVAHQNVTEHKRVQVELDESRKRIETIVDNVVDGIVTISATGRLETANSAAQEIFGYTASEIVGQGLNTLFSETHSDMHYRRLISVLQTQHSEELVGKRADGTLFPMYFAVREVYMNNRRIYTGIVQDITDRKRMEGEMLEKERISVALQKERELRDFKNRFIVMMSHELRTPLSSIKLSSDLLKLYGDRSSADERDSYLENIATQVEHLTALVKDMLTISRSEVSSLDFSPEPVDLITFSRQIIEEYQFTHRATHRFTFSSRDAQLITRLDSKLMRQVLTNLLGNAVKYSPHSSEIGLNVRLESPWISLQVSDQGIGIPEADLPLLFEPFHRAGNVENRPGTGLGLAIVKQAVELHGGQVKVASKTGSGTTFTICLPYRPKD